MGSWEMNLVNQKTDDILFPINKEILELEESFAPTLRIRLEVHVGESKILAKTCSN
jgi:hypothetical protein